jgi:hypothetical protein
MHWGYIIAIAVAFVAVWENIRSSQPCPVIEPCPLAAPCAEHLLERTHKENMLLLQRAEAISKKADALSRQTSTSHKIQNILDNFDGRTYINSAISAYQYLKLLGFEQENIKEYMHRMSGSNEELGKFVKSTDFDSQAFWESLKGTETYAHPDIISKARALKETFKTSNKQAI